MCYNNQSWQWTRTINQPLFASLSCRNLTSWEEKKKEFGSFHWTGSFNKMNDWFFHFYLEQWGKFMLRKSWGPVSPPVDRKSPAVISWCQTLRHYFTSHCSAHQMFLCIHTKASEEAKSLKDVLQTRQVPKQRNIFSRFGLSSHDWCSIAEAERCLFFWRVVAKLRHKLNFSSGDTWETLEARRTAVGALAAQGASLSLKMKRPLVFLKLWKLLVWTYHKG